ncbi:thioesterase II family protein [Silvanigrella aquatica]|uniref:Thioesterase domain-containing protein n=1 Tax=Silvanigrella aquatica TaxID=1915309 RepID=A0A1L4D1P4_9BACT|nr:thioesterase domain-containing protein [Silvanigrella aquatica]APJ04117.1 hypothetical protein AXG55_09435 [Silvanigrella aquatica]
MLAYHNHIYHKKSDESAKLRILFIHHAGGSAIHYFQFSDLFPKYWDISFLEIPGRGTEKSNYKVENRENLYSLFDEISSSISDIPLALFGHSFGAHIAYELAQYFQLKKNSPLIWLGISGKKPPHIYLKNKSDYEPAYLRSFDSLLQWLKSMGGTPQEFFNSPELMDYFIPILRNDLKLCHNLETSLPHFPKLEIPIGLFSGISDNRVSLEAIKEWELYSIFPTQLEKFAGGHFYFQNAEQILTDKIVNQIHHYL